MFDAAHILVIDDDPTILDLLSDLLSPSYDVAVECNSLQAAERVCREKVDLLILDLEMPIIDGFEVIHRVRSCSISANIPILVLSARPDLRSALRDAPVQAKIEKPFAVGRLLSTVEELLQGSRERVMQ